MDKLVRRIVKVKRSGGKDSAKVIYEKGASSEDGDGIADVAEKSARRMLRAERTFADNALRLHDESARNEEGGWLIDAPANIVTAHRKAYNVARKTAPFGLLPKIPKF
jgi:hypothetical protein